MIIKLRRKFVAILMCIVTTILVAVFVTMLIITQKSNEGGSIAMLKMFINQPITRTKMQPPQNNDIPPPPDDFQRIRVPVMLVNYVNSEDIQILSNHLFFIDDKDVQQIIQLAVDSQKDIAVINGYKLRYLKQATENSTHIAFADISVEQDTIKSLIINSLIIVGVAILMFFIVSIFLARWAVKPVETAWNKQRQFVADASHELKTPLTVILSNADMLITDNDDTKDKTARRLEHIKAEAVRMKQLVENMLALAKSDNIVDSPNVSLLDFSYIVTNALLTFEPIIFDEDKSLIYNIEDNIIVMGDGQKLQQLLHIMLDNANKYCCTSGMISVSLKKTNNSTVLLKVINEGTPIPTDQLEKIFNRFFQTDKSRSQQGGFGLGLAIAHNIVSEHKGKIWAQSDKKVGNSFFITLPSSH